MNTTTEKIALYKAGEMSIQDMMIEDAEGVLRSQVRGLTLAEYNRQKGGGFECVPFAEACACIRKLQDAHYIKPFAEITAEVYNDMLEVLPPENWKTVDGVNIFRMSEYTTGDITAHYASYKGRYFTAERRTSTPYAVIAGEVKAL